LSRASIADRARCSLNALKIGFVRITRFAAIDVFIDELDLAELSFGGVWRQ
jgi:hypothetical protein